MVLSCNPKHSEGATEFQWHRGKSSRVLDMDRGVKLETTRLVALYYVCLLFLIWLALSGSPLLYQFRQSSCDKPSYRHVTCNLPESGTVIKQSRSTRKTRRTTAIARRRSSWGHTIVLANYEVFNGKSFHLIHQAPLFLTVEEFLS